jgi:hypothetical protein
MSQAISPERPLAFRDLCPKRDFTKRRERNITKAARLAVRPMRAQESVKAIANRLCEMLEASTSYADLKEGLDRSWPNYDTDSPKWQRFYQHGLVIVMNEGGIVNAEGKATGMKIETASVNGDNKVSPGDIIESKGRARTGAPVTRYMVQTSGALRKL